jgi:hypothetical protein
VHTYCSRPCRTAAWAALAALGVALPSGCRLSDVLTIPTPAGAVDPSSVKGLTGAEGLRLGAISALNFAVAVPKGHVSETSLLTDEFTIASVREQELRLDGRSQDRPGVTAYPTDSLYATLQLARLTALQAIGALEPYPTKREEVGGMFALAGYAELFLAEDFCSGVPLSVYAPTAGVRYGAPLASDSLLGHAIGLFDSALIYSSDTVPMLAKLGRARALLDRGRYADAAVAATNVRADFAYVAELAGSPGFYQDSYYADLAQRMTRRVADRKGANGLDFVSANDPRVPIDSSLGQTPDGTTFYYPTKFPLGSGLIPFANGVEASLIHAEAALPEHGGSGTAWLDTLNALRAAVPGLAPLVDPGSDSARVTLLFRERAFWLFGTGTRLGDMRRLVRQYHRDQAAVFPTGPYPFASVADAPQVYGADVNFPLAAAEQGNPYFHGCIDRNP